MLDALLKSCLSKTDELSKFYKRKAQAVSELHTAATALHPTYVAQCVTMQQMFTEVQQKLEYVAEKLGLNKEAVGMQFSEFFNRAS